MAYVQDSFLTNDILHEMVSSLLGPGKCSFPQAPLPAWNDIYLFLVLGFELRAYTLSHSTSPFLCWVFFEIWSC
jgi:hypothetical protein